MKIGISIESDHKFLENSEVVTFKSIYDGEVDDAVEVYRSPIISMNGPSHTPTMKMGPWTIVAACQTMGLEDAEVRHYLMSLAIDYVQRNK